MTTLKNIIEGLDTLDGITTMDAKVGDWNIEILEWRSERRITFRREIPIQQEQEEVDE